MWETCELSSKGCPCLKGKSKLCFQRRLSAGAAQEPLNAKHSTCVPIAHVRIDLSRSVGVCPHLQWQALPDQDKGLPVYPNGDPVWLEPIPEDGWGIEKIKCLSRG